MQQKSKQALNVQFTIFQDIVIRKETLYKLNIYGDNRLSRMKTSWKQLCSNDANTNTLAKRIIGVCEKTKVFHSEFIMEDILASIMLCMEGCIPGEVGAEIPMLGRIVSDDVVSALTGGSTSVDVSSNDDAIRVLPLPSESDRVIGSGSMYKNEDVCITLFAIEENLSSEGTIRMTADYASSIRKKQLAEHDYDNDIEHPIAEDIAVIMCDGAPCAQYMSLLAEDRNEEDIRKRSYSCVMAFFGGFHAMMKCANCNGELFGNILTTLVGSWRKSSKKIEWFTLPSDPKQREAETPQHTAAHYAAAARSLREYLGRWPSAVEVNAHMMDQAEKYPICALILLFLRTEVILKMLRMSEKIGKRGCVQLFFYCLKLAVPIFAVTHKTDYVRLVCDLLQWYECASPAEKVIYEHLIYTQVTSKGQSQWSDLFMEKSIGDIRSQVGRTFYRGASASIEHACEKIPNKRNQGNVMDGLRSGMTGEAKKRAASKRTTKLFDDSALIRGLPVIEEMNLWHHNNPPRFEDAGEEIELSIGDVRLPGGDTVNPEVLDFFRTGSERVVEYFQYYNIDHPDKMTRSEKEISLRRILPSVKERTSVLERDIMTATSTKESELKALTVPELMVQIEETRKMLNSKKIDPQIKPEKKSGNKAEKIDRLIELRSILFAMDKEAKARERDEIRRQYQVNNEVFVENMNELLNDPMGLYAIHASVLDKPRYKNVPNNNP